MSSPTIRPNITATTDDEKKSIVIVGGGIIGSTTAYFLTRHPKYNPNTHKITLLEATGIASGASGKAGGLLALWAYPSCLVPLSYKLHKELADEHGGAERWGYRGVGCGQIDLVGRKIPADVGKGQGRRDGVVVQEDPGQDGKQQDVRGVHRSDVGSDGNVEQKEKVSLGKRSEDSYKSLRKMGFPDDLDWVDGDSVRGWDEMGDPTTTAQVHPYQFTTSMAKLAEEKGVNVVLGSVSRIDSSKGEEGSRHQVHYTDKESGETKTIDATDVVVTAGPWTKTVLPGTPIGALRAHSVTIRPSRPVSAYCLFTQIGLPKNFKDGHKSKAMHVTPEIYARPNDELYACGEGDHLVPLPKSTAEVEVDDARCQDIIDYCASFSDEMRDGQVLVRQACYLPQVETGGGPLVGPTNTPGVFLSAGHTCWGIQNGPASGKLMSEFIFDGKAVSSNIASLDPRKMWKLGGRQ